MKGVKKCYGLLLLLSIMLGLSLNVSFDVSAKQYTIDSIPLWYPVNYTNYPNALTGTNSFRITSNNDLDSRESLPFQTVVSSTLNQSDASNCTGVFIAQLPRKIISNNTLTLDYGFAGVDSSSSFLVSDPCLSINSLSFPSLGISTGAVDYSKYHIWGPTSEIPTIHSIAQSNLPYRFSYSGFYNSDQKNDSGVVLRSRFGLQDIYGLLNSFPSNITSIRVPFGPSYTTDISAGSNITFSGEVLYYPDCDSFDCTNLSSDTNPLSSDTSFTLEGIYMRPQDGVRTQTSICDLNYSFNPNSEDISLSTYSLFYSCSFDIPPDYVIDSTHFIWFNLDISLSYNYSDFRFGGFTFDSTLTTSNYDSTPAGSYSVPIVGGNTRSAPGSIYQGSSDSVPDFDSSLANLFNFGFFNPFQPLFNLFADDQSCANIPTISSMIHSQDTRVCHFFDSNTRNLLTPVFGLASTMLVFGFAVRWLGASSGNFFDDSGTHDTRHFRFSSRGVIKS